MKKLYLFIFCLIVFSFLIYKLGNYFFGFYEEKINKEVEMHYIEPSLLKNENLLNSPYLLRYRLDEKNPNNKNNNKIESNDIVKSNNIIKKEDNIKISLKSDYNIKFIYLPESLKKEVIGYTNAFNLFLNNSFIKKDIGNMFVELYKEKNHIRGKMKNRTIKLFGVQSMSISEYLAVGIHEFSHFVDIYVLKREVFNDISTKFYDISWEEIKIIKSGQTQKDFVSGYAMTNRYEDFSESFTYFVLHNKDFLEKSKKSTLLKAKYMYFSKFIFKDNKFDGTDFSLENRVESYYRDITKIDFSLKNFLIFLKKGI